MILNRRAQSAILAVSFTLIGAIYLAAWLAPSVAMDHESGVNLVLAKALSAGHGYVLDNLPDPVPETHVPPVFPALLALFALVSSQAQWLKLAPLGCAIAWLLLTRRLMLRMGASRESSFLLIGLAAISPPVIFFSASLVPEALFGLLLTASLLQLLDDRPVAAGLLAGLATLTIPAGAALIAACILTLAVRGRFRSAIIFTVVAMVMVAPWFGWSLAHQTHEAGLNVTDRVATNIITGLGANEKAIVASRNLVRFFAAPVELLSGFYSVYAAASAVLLMIWCLWMRRRLVPDLFLALFGLALLCFVWPPERVVGAVLPLIFWITWRALRELRNREAVAAMVLIVMGVTLWADGKRGPALLHSGVFPEQEQAADDWRSMTGLFGLVETKTSPGSVLLANLDGTFFARTGRKTVRGFTADGYTLFYTDLQSTVTPDQISSAILRYGVNYVALTPDLGEPESESFHRAVEALVRGGVLRPVEAASDVASGYRLLHVESAGY
jgi:hypothetical protein